MRNKFGSALFAALIGALMLPLSSFGAHAEIISTQQAVAIESGQAMSQVDAWLRREDVVAELASLGVDPEMALIRAQALSPAELEAMAERLDELPAGAGALEVLGITFLVLLVLELVGVTNIFNR